MAIIKLEGARNVVEAAEKRIINVFNNGLPVYFAFSGGKDSLCLSQLIVNLIQRGQIDPKQLIVYFLDEEAIYPCIEKTVLDWRRKFILLGAKFDWYCIECRHYNCFNELANDESFICFDSTKRDLWIRIPPSFAIRTHPLLKARQDTYQDFFARVLKGGIHILGVRAAESIQRSQNLSRTTAAKKQLNSKNHIFPIYDWKNNDVWLYLFNEKVEIPDIYLYLYQAGTGKNNLRVSQFFSIDTARSLVKMNEYYPDLMERIIRREPNAYLAALYWDSEMFGRSSKNRRAIEKNQKVKDYRKLLENIFSNLSKWFFTEAKLKIAQRYRHLYVKSAILMSNKDCQNMYEALLKGDQKMRSYRALYLDIYNGYLKNAKGGKI